MSSQVDTLRLFSETVNHDAKSLETVTNFLATKGLSMRALGKNRLTIARTPEVSTGTNLLTNSSFENHSIATISSSLTIAGHTIYDLNSAELDDSNDFTREELAASLAGLITLTRVRSEPLIKPQKGNHLLQIATPSNSQAEDELLSLYNEILDQLNQNFAN